MLLEIRLSNFFSIKKEIILDFRAGTINSARARSLSQNVFAFDDIEVLKTIAIYGANASGKSNIIKAIQFCHAMVFESHLHNENTKYNFKPFKFESYPQKPSTYFIKFVMDDVEYDYSFCLTQDQIITESLYYYPNNRKAKVFDRDERAGKKKKDKYSFGPSIIRRPLDVAENTSDKTLFISRASQLDRELPKKIFRYFNERFILNYLNYGIAHADGLIDRYKTFLLNGLQLADSDIVNFTKKRTSRKGKSVRADFITDEAYIEEVERENLEIKTFHRISPGTPFDLATEESGGTKKLFFTLLTIIDVVSNNKVLLIDEIEASLHPKIVEYIIQIFNTSERAQLLFSTHNTHLLDMKRFRKDQTWFVNKLADGSTDLYSLYDYSDFRDTMDLEKAYLQGRFDAVPIVDDSEGGLKELMGA